MLVLPVSLTTASLFFRLAYHENLLWFCGLATSGETRDDAEYEPARSPQRQSHPPQRFVRCEKMFAFVGQRSRVSLGLLCLTMEASSLPQMTLYPASHGVMSSCHAKPAWSMALQRIPANGPWHEKSEALRVMLD